MGTLNSWWGGVKKQVSWPVCVSSGRPADR
jgi:hypothetical protein